MKKLTLLALFCAAMMLPAAASWTPSDFGQTLIDCADDSQDTMSYYDPVMIRKADGTTLIAYESRGKQINPRTGQKMAQPMFYLHYQKLDKDGNKMFPGHGILISSQPNLNASFGQVNMDTLPNGNVVFDFADARRTSGESSELTFVGDGLKAYAYCYTQDGEPVWSPDGVQLPMYKHDSAALGRAYMGQQIGVSGEYIYFGSVMLEQVNEWVDTAYVGMFHYYRELVCMDKDGNILDLMGGVDDINNKLVKCVGDVSIKLQEDALRILRAVRFATVLNFQLDNDLYEGIKKYGYLVKNLSFFRKRQELDKIFTSNNVQYGFKLLKDLGLDKYLDINLDIEITDLMGIWAQIDNMDYPFSREEMKMINDYKNLNH